MTRREIIAVDGAFTKTMFYIVDYKRNAHNFNTSKYGVKGRGGVDGTVLIRCSLSGAGGDSSRTRFPA